MDEYDKLGRNQFLAEAGQLLSATGNGATRRPRDPLAISLENLQNKTKLNRKTFLAHVVEKIIADNTKITRLPTSQLTLPKLIAYYEPQLGKAKLESCALSVATEHSIVH